MNVLSIGTDRSLFEEGSQARQRMIEYGTLFDELHIVVFTVKKLHLKPEQIASNVWIYPTHSFSRWQYMRDAYRVGKKIIAQESFTSLNTVVTAQDPAETGRVGLKLKKKYGFPLQIQVHTDILSPFFSSQSFLQKLRVKMAETILPYADEIRVVSDRIKQSLITTWNISDTKIDVLPIFSPHILKKDITDHNEKYSQFGTVILMVSRLEPEKNISFAIDIFKNIHKDNPTIGLIIIGDGSLRISLEQKVQSLGLTQNIIFEGKQNNLEPYYRSADIFLHTSNFEGYGLVLGEAATYGLPIITSDVGIAGSILQDGISAYVCPVKDQKCFTEKLYKLIQDPCEQSRIAEGAKEAILHHTINSHEEYLIHYKKLLEKILQK